MRGYACANVGGEKVPKGVRSGRDQRSSEVVEQPAPPLKGLPAREMSLPHRADGAHGCDAFGIRGQTDERLGKLLRAADAARLAGRFLLFPVRSGGKVSRSTPPGFA